MNVLIINTSETVGGAAVAAKRLMEALNHNGVNARMLVRDKQTDNGAVTAVGSVWRKQWAFLWERWILFCHLRFSRKRLFEIDMANTGLDITRTPEFCEADVIHLQWVNQGMLSLRGIRQILKSGKPVVWTMHDFWPSTAICHYPRECRHSEKQCGNCPYLPNGGGPDDLSASVWRRKQKIWKRNSIVFVACSKWLGDRARQSKLLEGHQVVSIPNTINLHVFHPNDKQKARQSLGLPVEGRLILFVSQRITDKRKGMDYFIEACQQLIEKRTDIQQHTAVVILGGHSEEFVGKLPLTVHPLGYISDEQKILDVYNAADVFVLPSLEDNLPNTIMEAMACGLPCVGFRSGGIPEMIDHRKNGYLAEYKNASDLAQGIDWVLWESNYEELQHEAVNKVSNCWSQQSVALQYIEIYRQALEKKRAASSINN